LEEVYGRSRRPGDDQGPLRDGDRRRRRPHRRDLRRPRRAGVPPGRERIRGKANIIAFRSAYPARVTLDLQRTIGRQDLWVNDYVIRYDDGKPLHVVGIMEFRDGKVVRERIYFGEPWEPPAWRA
jgi:hypothetical protein